MTTGFAEAAQHTSTAKLSEFRTESISGCRGIHMVHGHCAEQQQTCLAGLKGSFANQVFCYIEMILAQSLAN